MDEELIQTLESQITRIKDEAGMHLLPDERAAILAALIRAYSIGSADGYQLAFDECTFEGPWLRS